MVLAAGESTRMGAAKPLLPWPDADSQTTLLEYQVAQLRAAGAGPIVVVTGTRAAEVALAASTAGAAVIHNADYWSGKASSVRAGVRATPEDAATMIVGADQPRPAWMLRLLVLAVAAGAPVAVPAYGRRRGHPPVFAAALRPELLAVDEATLGLRAVIQRHAVEITNVEVSSPIALLNLNTPDDLAAARLLFAQPAS